MIRRMKTTLPTRARQSETNPKPRSLRSVRRLKTILTSLVAAAVVCALLLSSADNQRVQAKTPMLPFATLTVTNTNDSGAGSLRQAISDAASGDTINFNLSGCPCTITLTSGELVINKNLTIQGLGANQLTISGNNISRVFFVNPGASGATTGPPATSLTVNLSNLTIANGKAKGGVGGSRGRGSGGGGAGLGGGLFINNGLVLLENVTFAQNQAIGGDGGPGAGLNQTGGGGGGGMGGDGVEVIGGNGGNLGGLAADPNTAGGEGSGGGGSYTSIIQGGGGGFGGGGAGALDPNSGGFGGGGSGGSSVGGSGGFAGGKGGNGESSAVGGGGGGGGGGLGGAIFIRAGQLTLSDISFTSNSAAGGNGGLSTNTPGPAGEKGLGKGGALFIHTGATAKACTAPSFNNNTATNAAGSGTDTNDIYGNLTSCNTAPTINATGFARTVGATGNAPIATVNDAEDAENTLSVTATLSTGSGVTVNNISVDASGNVTADVTASCTATNSSFTLQVTDSGSLSVTTTLTVTVNANQLPVLSYPSNPGTGYGTGITVNPLTGPSDDIGVTSVVVQSITPSNPGGISVNNSTGVVTVANNVPAGSYTVAIRANAACGFKDASFSLFIVKATPVLTWNNPANITYGTPLSSTQLNATANVAGSFAYTPASGTVLNAGNGQTLTANFTPGDTTNYSSTSKQVQLNVLKAPLTVTVNNAFRNQGEANPPFSGSVTGQKNGDVITATYSTTATTASAPGNYPITATLVDAGNRLGNYQVTNNPGTLTILNSCGIVITPATLLQPSLALPYSQLLSANPTGTYTFNLFAGSLPPGLQIVNNYGSYMLQGTPTASGTFTFTIRTQRSSSTCEAIRTYTVTIAPTVVPKVTCKILNANGSYTVRFGYENTTGSVVTIPVGANNTFTSGAANRGQTTVFQPGVVNNAFSVTFANAGEFTSWNLKGPDGGLRGVTPSVLSPNCP